jgi:hypothetical protein
MGEAFSQSFAQVQLSKQLLENDASREGSQPLILEAKLWDGLDGNVKL